MREEEEEMTVPIEELDRYFLFPSGNLASSPISKHLETMHEHLNGTFPMNPAVSAQLQESLPRIAKLIDVLVSKGQRSLPTLGREIGDSSLQLQSL